MKSKRGKISILLVPEDEGEARSFRLSRGLLKLLTIGGIILAVLLSGVVISYCFMLKKVISYNEMAAENRRLIDENRRIYQLSQDLEQLKSMDRRIRHALGAPVEAGGKADTVIYEVLERGSERTESIFSQYEIVFISPLEGLVTRGYQEDIFPRQSHRGIDLAVPEGTIVNAAADGWVLFSGWHPRYGKFLILQHWGDYSTFYGHLSAVLVEVGEAVKLGSPAAVSGNSGRSTAPHLHFEIRHRGVSLDPQNFIQSLSGMQYNITEKDSVSEEQFEADNLESMN